MPRFVAMTYDLSMSRSPLETAFITALGLPEHTDLSRLEFGKTPKWDSVAQIQLAAAIETAFDIILEGDDIVAMTSYHAASDLLEKKYGIASR
jgi:acyl carrier protein